MSPYLGVPIEDWIEKTKELIRQQPLKPDVIREVAVTSWEKLWKTKIGEGETVLSLEEIDPPAIVIGYIFEKLFAKELHRRYPQQWRGMQNKDEKDIVCLENSKFSIEIKKSGQLGTKIFSNRSYGQ